MTLLYDVVREEEKALLKAAERLGMPLRPLRVGDVLTVEGWEPDVYLVRTLSHNRGIVAAAAVEAAGGLAINSSTALMTCWNKAVTLARLRAAGLPTPRTEVLFGRAEATFRGPAIVKAVSGSWGRKVALVSSGEELGLLLRTADDDSVLLLQEKVGDGTDIRAFVVEGQVVAAMRRVPPRGEWRSNAARGGSAHPQAVDPQLAELAVKAAEAVGAFYAGVDILVGDGYYVNEVNGISEFKALQRATGVDVAEVLIAAVARQARR